MKFSSHQLSLIYKVECALTKDKKGLVEDFVKILNQARELYKTDSFDFWLDALNCPNIADLPLTKYGRGEALRSSKDLRTQDKNKVEATIQHICELLFTYSNDNDCCELQSDFHYYFSISNNCIFKESELGMLEGIESNKIGEFRIAYISDLVVSKKELYA